MRVNRRDFLGVLASGVAASAILPATQAHANSRKGAGHNIKVVAFDAFPVFDPRPVFARAEALFPGKGTELANAWRTRQFEYTWLRTLGGKYQDFWSVTGDALDYAARQLGLGLGSAARKQLMEGYLELKAWPDAPVVLEQLGNSGLRLVFLSNFTSKMLDAAAHNSGLAGLFEPHLSTDRVGAFKPSPRAYQMALDTFGVSREEILFVASAAWDAAGATWFGFPCAWINRMGLPPEELGASPGLTAADLSGLPDFIKGFSDVTLKDARL